MKEDFKVELTLEDKANYLDEQFLAVKAEAEALKEYVQPYLDRADELKGYMDRLVKEIARLKEEEMIQKEGMVRVVCQVCNGTKKVKSFSLFEAEPPEEKCSHCSGRGYFLTKKYKGD